MSEKQKIFYDKGEWIMQDLIEVQPIKTKVADEYSRGALDITTEVNKLLIDTQEQYERGAYLRKSMKEMIATVDAARKKITQPLDAAKKAVMDLFRPVETCLDNGIHHVDSILVDYTTRKERECFEQEEKLRKQAEAEEVRKKKAFEERAQKAEEAGNMGKAEDLRQKAEEVSIQAPTLAPAIQKIQGLSYREDWSAEVVDLKALVNAVAEGRAPLNFIEANTKVLNQQARATKDSLVVPGVKFKSTKVPVGR